MNRLSEETSPYLLQHAHNPVHWYAWKPEAFEQARLQQKPILVSIGYSTCHWCHVMERESFENQDIADFMNDRFINIKVDREERPDVDAIYMDACQVLTGSGGWPLNCFLTPEGKPFYAGTYYPPRPAHNRPSWLQLLQHIAGVWETQRTVALEQAERLMGHISHADRALFKPVVGQPDSENNREPGALSREELATLFHNMQQQFDREEGGFGGAPKFPSTMALVFLMQFHYVSGNSEALRHALFSLEQMISGGIYDQLGGGFARYSTDREWLAPHFEKMLYDNALLVTTLCDAWKISGKSIFRETIEETLAYIEREMTHPDGGFYSAQDADSEGEEGKFFVWQKAEVDAVLGEHADLFCTFYDVGEAGNWEGRTILWRLESFEAFAEQSGIPLDNLKTILKTCREKLFAVREQRVKPGLDDKILLGWNALMCSAYAQAYAALGHEPYREAAIRNIDFVLTHFDKDEQLMHVWKDGKAQYAAMLDDYAFLIDALLQVWQISFNVRYLLLAEKYTEQVLSYFLDKESDVFYYTAADQSDIILRKKDLYDNATPSGNSTMALNLQRLAILADRPDWRDLAGRLLEGMRDTAIRYPLSFERWASAMLQHSFPTMEVAVVGKNAFEKAAAIRQAYLPNMILAAAADAEDRVPLLAGKSAEDDALIYVCQNFVCRQPVVTLESFQSLAEERNLLP